MPFHLPYESLARRTNLELTSTATLLFKRFFWQHACANQYTSDATQNLYTTQSWSAPKPSTAHNSGNSCSPSTIQARLAATHAVGD